MTDLDKRIRVLKDRHAAAVAAHARAGNQVETARARLDELTARLRTEFGVTTSDEARTMLAALHEQLDQQLAEANAALDNIGG